MTKNKRPRFITLLTVLSLMFSLCSGIIIVDNARAESADKGSVRTKPIGPALAQYALDLTDLARQGRLDIEAGHDAAIGRTIQTLARGQQNNPVLIDESGATSIEVVEGLAQRIATGDVPANLRQTRVYSLNLNALLNGVKTSVELEKRLKAVLADATSASENSILFVDELHQFVGTRAAQTVSQTLADAAARGNVRLMGA